MTWLSSLRRLLAAPPTRRPRAAASRLTFRPRLEALEDRSLPSASFGSAFRIGPDTPGPSGGWGRDIAADAAGNTYVTGLFDGAVDFDPAHPGTDGVQRSKNNAQNTFVAKYAADGAFLWAERMGGDGSSGPTDLGKALAVDASGNVYVVGSFSNNADFGSFTLTSAAGDGFVAKLNASGNFQWVQPYTNGDGGGMGDVAVDGGGNIYVTRSVNPSLSSANSFAVVDRLADGGTSATQVWEDKFGNTGANNVNTGTGVKADALGHVFVTGTFTGAVNFNLAGNYTLTSPKVKGQYAQEGFVLELTAGNGFGWAKEIASLPNDLALDGSDNVYTTGASGNSLQLGTGGPLNAAKLSASGALLWSKNFANGAQNAGGAASFGVAVDGTGNVYTTGYFTGTANFNPGGTFNLTSAGDRDIFVSEFNTSGAFLWAGAMGGAGRDQAASVAVDGAGNIYTTGLFGGYVSGVSNYTADFDPGAGVYDLTPLSTDREIFVSKLIPTSSGLPASTSAASPEIGSFTTSADPTAGGGSLTLSASNITDGNASATITQVAFYVQVNGVTTRLGYGTQGSGGVWNLTFTVNLAPGSYTLFAQAQDSNGVFGDPLAATLQMV
jgi:hypothetical protein